MEQSRRQSQSGDQDDLPAAARLGQGSLASVAAGKAASTPAHKMEHDGEVVQLFYDKPLSFLGRIKRVLRMQYTSYHYTFVFNCMDWWERVMMHAMLWGAVALVVWGLLHQGSAAAQYARHALAAWNS